MLAHELRNPLGTISNALQVLRMKGEGDETCEAGDRRRRAAGPPPGDADRRPAGGLPRHPRPGRAAVRGAGPDRARARDRRGLPRRPCRRPASTLALDLPDGAAADPRRPPPPLAGALEPAGQRRQVHRPGRPHRRAGAGRRRRPARRGQRPRHRRRHPRRRSSPTSSRSSARGTTASTAPRGAWAWASPWPRG